VLAVNSVVPYADLNQFNYEPAANNTNAVTFTWRAADGYNLSTNTSTVTITITGINDAPTGTTNTVATNEDTQYTFTTANF
jgi:VCBS repeat-containing protein